jgi:hypothetical protein
MLLSPSCGIHANMIFNSRVSQVAARCRAGAACTRVQFKVCTKPIEVIDDAVCLRPKNVFGRVWWTGWLCTKLSSYRRSDS